MSNIAEQLIRATLSKFEADRQEALAVIELFLNHPVGVAEHPTVIEELVKATERLASAEESMEALKRSFLVAEPEFEPEFDEEE